MAFDRRTDAVKSWLGGKRGAGVPEYGVRGPGLWKTRGLVENARVWWKTRESGGKREVPFFSPKYEFSSLKWEARILLAYTAMNINSAPWPQMRLLDQQSKFREKENHSKANVSCIVSGRRCVTWHILGLPFAIWKTFLFEINIACPIKFMFLLYHVDIRAREISSK